jgi:hypothetical protein
MGLRELELATLCMQSKGYRQVPIATAPTYSAATSSSGYAVSTSSDDARMISCRLPGRSTMMLAGDCRRQGGTQETETVFTGAATPLVQHPGDNDVVMCTLPDGYTGAFLGRECRDRGGKRDTASTAGSVPEQTAPVQLVQQSPGQSSRQIGTFVVGAERVAREEKCSSTPVAVLTAKGAGFESFNVSCANGDVLAIRCELGNCRALK